MCSNLQQTLFEHKRLSTIVPNGLEVLFRSIQKSQWAKSILIFSSFRCAFAKGFSFSISKWKSRFWSCQPQMRSRKSFSAPKLHPQTTGIDRDFEKIIFNQYSVAHKLPNVRLCFLCAKGIFSYSKNEHFSSVIPNILGLFSNFTIFRSISWFQGFC